MFKIMLKTFFITFIFLAVCFSFLLDGFIIDTFSFNNFKIKKLYLKYDKNLILHIDNLEILNNDNSTIVNIDTKLELSYNGAIIKKLNISNIDLAVTGIVRFNPLDSLIDNNYKFTVHQVDFMFESKLPHLKAKKLDFDYINDNIILKFDQPTCDNIKIYGSNAIIRNITSKKTTILDINLHSQALLQTNLLKILAFYDIKLPFYQKNGINDIFTKLTIPFDEKPIEISAKVKSFKTNLKVNNINIPVEKLEVILKNNKIISTMEVKEKNTNIHIDNITNLNLNTSDGIINIQQFKYDDLIDINNTKFEYIFNMDENILRIPEFDFHYTIAPHHDYIYIRYLNKLVKYITFLNVTDKDTSSIYIDSINNFKTINVEINNLDLHINDKYFDKDNKKDKEEIILPLLNANLNNGKIIYKDFLFEYNTLKINTLNSDVNLKYFKDNATIFLHTDINKNEVHIQGDKINDKVFNKIIKKDFIKDGYLQFNIDGTYDKITGKVTFNKTTIQNVQLLNNLITFISTTPAIINPLLALPTLFRLGETNFDMQGYYIKNGFANFSYNFNDKNLKVLSLYTKSKMMDFKGKGNINLENKLLKANIDAIFMKDYAKFLNHIPIVGYVITGEDESFATQVDINGTFDEPTFTTHTVKNTVEGVSSGIFRLITLPFKIFDSNFTNTTPSNKKQHKDIVNEILGGKKYQ